MPKPARAVRAKRERTRSVGEDLAYSLAFFLWGVLLDRFFPWYADLGDLWSIPFRGLGYVCYAVGFVGALSGIGNLMSGLASAEFRRDLGFGSVFGLLAFGFHAIGQNTSTGSLVGFALRLIVLVFLSIALLGCAVAVARLAPSQQREEELPRAAAEPTRIDDLSPPTVSVKRTWVEQSIGLLIAILSTCRYSLVTFRVAKSVVTIRLVGVFTRRCRAIFTSRSVFRETASDDQIRYMPVIEATPAEGRRMLYEVR